MHELLRHPSSEFTNHLREISITEIPEVDNDPEMGVTWSYPRSGIELKLQNDRVATVFLFGEKTSKYSAHPAPPYEGIEWNHTFEDVQVSMGEPSLFSDGNPDSEFGPIPPWLRYDLDRYCVHFEFSSDKQHIRKVTFMAEAP